MAVIQISLDIRMDIFIFEQDGFCSRNLQIACLKDRRQNIRRLKPVATLLFVLEDAPVKTVNM